MYFYPRRPPLADDGSGGFVSKVLMGLSATAMVPAHGFIFQGRGAVAAAPSPLGMWMRAFLGACAWGFMIAAGSLVYNHFVKKWQSSGLPMLPIAALVSGASTIQQSMGQAPSQQQASAGGLGSGAPQFTRARQPGQTSFLEEYEG